MAKKREDPTAFVVMAFDGRLQPVYLKVIQPVLMQHGYRCVRADEQSAVGVVVDQVREAINAADVILCDLTFHNPNVFYELGVAHTLKKEPILLSQDAGNIPFDVCQLRVIPYEDSKFGLLDLREKLVEVLETIAPGRSGSGRKRKPPPATADELQEQRLALFSRSPDFRGWAIKFLGDNQDKESYARIAHIAFAVESYDADLKREAFTALYKIDADQVRPHLLESGLQRQPLFLVRERVVELLGHYTPDAELVQQISEQAGDSSWGVRRRVCEVLGRWGMPETAGTLRMLLSDPQPQVSLAAVEALGRLREPIGAHDEELRAEAQQALDRVAGPLDLDDEREDQVSP